MRGALRERGPSLWGVLCQLGAPALLFGLFAGVGVFHVTARLMVVDSAYSLSHLEQEERRLAQENDKLEVELATLKSPARLERLAKEQLGLAPPPPGAVLSPAKARARRSAP